MFGRRNEPAPIPVYIAPRPPTLGERLVRWLAHPKRIVVFLVILFVARFLLIGHF